MKHSTGNPTKAEGAYIDACKSGFCVACMVWEAAPESPPLFVPNFAHEFHHFISGGIRVGHFWGVGLCQYHHRGIPLEGWRPEAMRRHFGPSLMDGSRTFHAVYGSDAELLERQDAALLDWGIQPPARPENRRWAA